MKTHRKNQDHGGRRPGAGRKPGAANRRTREIADRAAREGKTPLEVLLEIMRAKPPAKADAKTVVAVSALRFEAAKAAAPYMHPRLAARDEVLRIPPLSGCLAEQGRAVLAAMYGGQIPPSQAGAVISTLAAQARIVEVAELEARVRALEAQAAKGGDGA